MFVSNALIGLREGLEAALVVVILLAFLKKTNRTWGIRYVWLGVGTAIALSVVLGAALTYGTRQLSFEAQELIGGLASIIAVGFVTAMVFWMKSAARTISGELKGKLDRALDLGPLAVALVAFLGVGREGLETAIFFYATAEAAGAGNNLPLLGWLVGFAGAVLLGWLIYRGALRINLGALLQVDRRRADPRRGRHPLLRHPRPAGGRRAARPEQPRLRRLRHRRPEPLVRAPCSRARSTSPRRPPCSRPSRGCSTSAPSCSSSCARRSPRLRARRPAPAVQESTTA